MPHLTMNFIVKEQADLVGIWEGQTSTLVLVDTSSSPGLKGLEALRDQNQL